MKKHLLLFSFALICNALCSQDLIIAENRDSINCQILAIDDGMIYFNTADERAKIISLPLEQVQSFSFGYYPNTQPDHSYRYKKKSDYARFRVAIAGGYSCRTFSIPDGTSSASRDYQNKSRHGYHYGVEFNYYFHRFMGIGISYYDAHFNPEGACPEFYPKRTSTKARIQQIIPTFNFRVLDRQRRGALVGGIGIGYAGYNTKFYDMNNHNKHGLTEKGWTVGMLWSIGYDVPVSQTMAIYFQASLNSGVVTNITTIDEETGKTYTETIDDINYGVGLGKINLSIGVRFAK